MSEAQDKNFEPSFSMLVMSLASSSLVALGLTEDPQTGKKNKDRQMARFNIDLLIMLQEKTKNNLLADEQTFLTQIIQDLQIKFIQAKD